MKFVKSNATIEVHVNHLDTVKMMQIPLLLATCSEKIFLETKVWYRKRVVIQAICPAALV